MSKRAPINCQNKLWSLWRSHVSSFLKSRVGIPWRQMVNRKKCVLSCVGKDFNWGSWSGEYRHRCVRQCKNVTKCVCCCQWFRILVAQARQWFVALTWDEEFLVAERSAHSVNSSETVEVKSFSEWLNLVEVMGFNSDESNGGNGVHDDEWKVPNCCGGFFFSC